MSSPRNWKRCLKIIYRKTRINFLLDTSIFIWLLEDSIKLKPEIKKVLVEEPGSCYVSSISIVEIELKRSIKKIVIPDDFRDFIKKSGLKALVYDIDDSQFLTKLPFHHKDPFDRMLISQAIAKNLCLITSDPVFRKYPVKIII